MEPLSKFFSGVDSFENSIVKQIEGLAIIVVAVLIFRYILVPIFSAFGYKNIGVLFSFILFCIVGVITWVHFF